MNTAQQGFCGFASRIVLAAGIIFAAASCDNLRDQPSRRPLEESPLFPDGTSSRPRPAHTVARGEPWSGSTFMTGLQDGKPVERIPMHVDLATIERGRDRFGIYCAVCHGEDGYGGGIVPRRGFPPPPSYHQDRLRNAPDGYLYSVITRGYGVMLPYSDRLDPADRWAVVAYIRALQRSQHAVLAALPPGDRLQFSAP